MMSQSHGNHNIIVHHYRDANINIVIISESDEECVGNNNGDVDNDSNVSIEEKIKDLQQG